MGLKGMGGFSGLESSNKKARPATAKYSTEMLHKAECAACPLNGSVGLRNPNMKATGHRRAEIYMLGEAPGKDEDTKGEQFVGKSGQVLRRRIPREWKDRLRWNNVVRTRPPENRTPNYIEIECCRPSVIRDIEETKPKAIFGFGNIPLTWATGLSGISYWCGRYMPVKIGEHVCWFFPMYHPSYVARMGGGHGGSDGYSSEIEFAFDIHLRNAFELVKKLPKARAHSKADALEGIEVIDGSGGDSDVKKISRLLGAAADVKVAGLDYETNGIRPYADGSKVLTASVSTSKRTFAFPFRHKQSPWSSKQLAKVEGAWQEFLEESQCLKAVHNLPFELEWTINKFGKEALKNGHWGCSQSQAYILDERYGSGAQSLDGLCRQYFGISIKSINPVDRANLDNTDLGTVLLYNGVDAKYHRLLFEAQAPRIVEEDLEEQYHHNVERMAGLVLMQAKGVPVNHKRALKFHEKYTKQVAAIDTEFAGMKAVSTFKKKFQKPFNPGSNDDVLKLMVTVLGHQVGKSDVEAIAGLCPEADLVLKRRKIAKLDSTYIVPALPGSPVLFNGRFHPVVSTTITRTWRTSSDSPNSQNYPKYGLGKEVRKIVKAGRNQVVVAFDFAGIQARNVAMESKDKNLVKYFRERYDIHTDWMERIARHHPKWIKEGVKKLATDKEVAKHYRQQAKNKFVFATFFGAGSKTTSGGLGVPESIGDILGREFKEEFPGVAEWHKTLRKLYRQLGYVTGLSGFRRRAPVAATEVINTPIQSDESVIVLDSLIRLTDMDDERLVPNLEIHDDLTFIWDRDEVEELAEIVIRAMLSTSFEWAKIVPLGVEMSIGEDWASLENVGEYYSDTWDGNVLLAA